ncbi:MAG: UvrB/UvrC motif-containing protein, partial [Patescibacteria group bacterium]
KHKITPKTIQKRIHDIVGDIERTRKRVVSELAEMDKSAFGGLPALHAQAWQAGDIKKLIKEKRRQMHDAADRLDFETAALLRDEVAQLEKGKKSPVGNSHSKS